MAVKRLVLALRIVVGSASFAGVLTTLALVESSSAQSVVLPTISEPAEHMEDSPQSEVQLAGDDEPQVSEDSDMEQPPDTNLETGLPLKVLLTPFHWGRFSLLSATASEGYNSNAQFQKVQTRAIVTSISALALYSAQFAGWRMNLQYQPFLWISSNRILKNFAAASLDLRTLHRINNNWHWTLADRFRYAPTHSTEQGKGFVADPAGGFSIGNVFLSSGRDMLANGIAGTLTDRYSENSTLMFHASQGITRLASYVGRQSADNLPAQEAITFSTGVGWHNRFSAKDTLNVQYSDRVQTSLGTASVNVNSQTASVGWSHRLTPGFGVTASIGPAWSIYGHRNANASGHGRATLHGSLALSHRLPGGGVVLAFSRSNGFSGIISDSFHNRADLAVHRQFNAHLSCSMSASYVEQQFSNARAAKGEIASAEARYFVSRNLAFFTQVRYLHITGNERILAPQTSAVAGVRWSWVPEKP